MNATQIVQAVAADKVVFVVDLRFLHLIHTSTRFPLLHNALNVREAQTPTGKQSSALNVSASRTAEKAIHNSLTTAVLVFLIFCPFVFKVISNG